MANILGLIYLIKDESEKAQCFDMIESEAKCFDETVIDINNMIAEK